MITIKCQSCGYNDQVARDLRVNSCAFVELKDNLYACPICGSVIYNLNKNDDNE